MANSEEIILSNQQTILDNQSAILNNQRTITDNQQAILNNQQTITHNQAIIVNNQGSIIVNQKQIVNNQVALSVISQSQAYVLNLVRKIAGKKESQKDTNKFLEKLRVKAEKALKLKGLKAPKKL